MEKKKKILISISKDVHEQLKTYLNQEDTSVSNVIEKLVVRYLSVKGGKNKDVTI